MSAKKPQQGVILGPNGKPYLAPPKPKAEEVVASLPEEATITLSVDTAPAGVDVMAFMTRFLTSSPYQVQFGHSQQKKPAPLRDAVADQVQALTAEFMGQGGTELPAPPRDLTAYADAFASASAHCEHPNAEEIVSFRQYLCPDCRRLISWAEWKRTRRGWFG